MEVPTLPGCFSQVGSVEEALENVREDTALLEYAAGNGMAIFAHNIADFEKLHQIAARITRSWLVPDVLA